MRATHAGLLLGVLLWSVGWAAGVGAEEAATAQPADASAPAVVTVSEPTPAQDYYVEPRSYGTKRETEPPSYVRSLDATGLPGTEKLDWLDLGFEQRTRYEMRYNDLRRTQQVTDNPLLLRTRAYFGIKNFLDPFRFALEIQDSRRYFSQFERDNRDVNTFEPIQAYAVLYFKEALG